MTEQHRGLLTVSVLAAAFFASNGVEALRVSLNRAYRVSDRRAWYWTRAQSLLFVLIAVFVFMAVSIILVLVPLFLGLVRRWLPLLADVTSLINNWRVLIAGIVLVCGLDRRPHLAAGRQAAARRRHAGHHADGSVLARRCLRLCRLSQGFANYVSTYAGLASIMIALVFLYIIAAIFILGAELNASILALKQ